MSALNLRWILPVVALVGCDLSEVEVPEGEPIVVVQGVMRSDLPDQWCSSESTPHTSKAPPVGVFL